jgi:hypothetical protein
MALRVPLVCSRWSLRWDQFDRRRAGLARSGRPRAARRPSCFRCSRSSVPAPPLPPDSPQRFPSRSWTIAVRLLPAVRWSLPFSNGDIPISLVSLQDGNWTNSWQPRGGSANTVAITVEAQVPELNLRGIVQASLGLQAARTLPVLSGGPCSWREVVRGTARARRLDSA